MFTISFYCCGLQWTFGFREREMSSLEFELWLFANVEPQFYDYHLRRAESNLNLLYQKKRKDYVRCFVGENSQSLRPKLAIPSRVLTRPVGLPLPDAERNPPTDTCCCAARGAFEESSLRVNWGTQHVVNHDGPEHPPSSRTPPPTQHSTVKVQLSHCPSWFYDTNKR